MNDLMLEPMLSYFGCSRLESRARLRLVRHDRTGHQKVA